MENKYLKRHSTSLIKELQSKNTMKIIAKLRKLLRLNRLTIPSFGHGCGATGTLIRGATGTLIHCIECERLQPFWK